MICNRPDGEAADQPVFAEIERAARELGMEARYLPAESGKVSDEQGQQFGRLLDELPKPVLAYCRTGMRSMTMWALSQASQRPLPDILQRSAAAGFDLKGVQRRIANGGKTPVEVADASHEVVIVGGGAAGLAVAASLLKRRPGLDVAIIDPADIHYYQPGWTLVGAGVFDASQTVRTLASVLPEGVRWIKAAVAAFEPERDAVILDGCRVVKYRQLVVAAGLKLDWDAIEGLPETLGRNGVTSNYRYDLAPYTWELVRGLRAGRALFTQPPMPIKCAGAPQKAMYLSADHWLGAGALKDIEIGFYSAGAALFGVQEYVPALMEYVGKYGIGLNLRPHADGRRRPGATRHVRHQRAGRHTPAGHARVRPAARRAAAEGARLRPGQSAGRRGRLGRRGPRHAAAPQACERVRARGRRQHAQREDGGGRPQAGAGGRAQRARHPRRSERGGALRRLRVLPAHRREREDRAGGIPLWRQAGAQLPALADRRHEALAARVVPQGADPAAAVLAGHVERPRMAGATGTRGLSAAAPWRRWLPALPILEWGRGYDRPTLAADGLAALIVTIMLIPQSLAYALLAGLPPEAGLYASMAPLLAYALFGSSRVLAVGPVAVVSLMTAAAIAPHAAAGSPAYWTAALVLALLSGLMLLVLGVLRLGFLANFLSHPVISGFISASAIVIAASQLKTLLGIPAKGETLPLLMASLASHLHDVHWLTLAIGAAATAFLFWVRKGLKPLLISWGLGAARGGHAGQGRTGGRHRGDHGAHLGVRLARARREDRGRHPGRTAAPHLAILRRRPVGRAGGARTADRRGGFR